MRQLARVHAPPVVEAGDSWRAGKTTAERGYGGRWQKARLTFLRRPENVLCRLCKNAGRVELATVVDHRVPHRGDQTLFWDTDNWQPLCKACHDSHKQSLERGGSGTRTVGLDGLPRT
ncbi:MAG TPA: HNH endonuclease signature motif containing protein [Luteimonas sp.]